jgi:ATP-dependent helicase/nuclease subunit A
MVIDKKCGLCVCSLDANQYTKVNSLARMGAVINANRTMIAEEMRLMYVALTRAKNHLIIVGAKNLEGFGEDCSDFDIQNSKSFLAFLSPTIMRSIPDCAFSIEIINLGDVQIQKPKHDIKIPCGKSDPKLVENLRSAYNYQYPNVPATKTILKNTVTSLTASQPIVTRAPRQTRDGDIGGAEYGTRFHRAMQVIDFANPSHDDNTVVECAVIVAQLTKGMQIYRELPFLQSITKNGAEILVQGVIDLLAVGDSEAIIVDYKTTRLTPEQIRETSQAQIAMYRDAVRQAVDIKNIRAYIYSTVHKVLIEI